MIYSTLIARLFYEHAPLSISLVRAGARRAAWGPSIVRASNFMFSLFVLISVLFVCYGAFAAPASLEGEKRSLAITWKVLKNRSAASLSPSVSELVVTNNGSQALGNHGWELYFNFCRKISPGSDSDEVRIVHINGDLYRVEPRSGFLSFRPGTSRTIRFETEIPLIKESDAPSGFYLVKDDAIRQEKSVEALGDPTLGPIDPKTQTMRARDDQVAVPTPESRYQENLQLLSVGEQDVAKVVPSPLLSKSVPGLAVIDRKTVIAADPQLGNEASYLANALSPLIGATLTISDQAAESGPDTISLSVQEITVAGKARTAGDHAYTLSVGAEGGITIVGTDPAGVFYGIQSLRACLPISAYRQVEETISIPACEIEDAPCFGYRGLHLDVARNFHSASSVKKLLELMSFYKLNKFHFHLTDDEGWRLEIAGLPELTEIGGQRSHGNGPDERLPPSFGSGPDPQAEDSHGSGYYSRAEFVDILQFAAARHIEVIPEIDLPGHARAAVQSMKARQKRLLDQGLEKEANEFVLHDLADQSKYESVQLWNDNVVNVCLESTDSFVKHVLNDIRDMYAEAGVTLKTIHLGGDEVPDGVWDDSPAYQKKYSPGDGEQATHGKEAMADFFTRISEYVASEDNIVIGAWEEVFLNDLKKSQVMQDATRNRFMGPNFQCYVWNNVWGWGQEDVAYRLANGGVKIVLCNATHLYFDLAYDKHPEEPGYYWAGFVETKTPYSFAPRNYLAKTRKDIYGHDIALESINRRVRLTEEGSKHILGIQGQLWGENLKGQDQLEYMALPKLIALAERAWAVEPEWISDENPDSWPLKFRQAWSHFAAQLGTRELPRLDYFQGGFNYRIPDAGAVIEDGVLKANVAFPGLEIRYTTDGGEPDANSRLYKEPISVGTRACLKVFTSTGRAGRSCTIKEQVFRVK